MEAEQFRVVRSALVNPSPIQNRNSTISNKQKTEKTTQQPRVLEQPTPSTSGIRNSKQNALSRREQTIEQSAACTTEGL